MRPVYYNDNDPYCAEWLRNLIAAGHLPEGEVDGRDIREVKLDDLEGYDQAHFFAGIGGWPYALRLAGWQGPVWTASIPCQPLSSAGRRKGHADRRHLWPAFYRLVAERHPAIIFGEQVASKDGREWLAGIRADLVELGYAVGAADLPAAGVGAPHIRQRVWWVAYAAGGRRIEPARPKQKGEGRPTDARPDEVGEHSEGSRRRGGAGRLGVTDRSGSQPRRPTSEAVGHGRTIEPTSDSGGLGDADSLHTEQFARERTRPNQASSTGPCGEPSRSGLAGFWSAHDLIPCGDGKARRVEPGTFPLAHGVSSRVGRLRAFGNAIVPQVAAEFVMAFMEIGDVAPGPLFAKVG